LKLWAISNIIFDTSAFVNLEYSFQYLVMFYFLLHKAKIKESQATSKMLSQECSEVEVNICILKSKELVNKEEIPSLESAILEFKKEIAIETEGHQDLLVKKSKAEAGMYDCEK
jgi:hypothetical protein